MKNRLNKYYKYFLVIILILFPLFGKLDKIPVQLWDESRLAINALEMFENGNLLVTYYKGEPDFWNTKPPLMIWFQSLNFHLFGVNEFSLRLPSAIAALLTAIFLLFFAHYYLRNSFFGIVAVLVLITSSGYVSIHGTRTGDYDSLLTLFTTVSSLSFFIFCECDEKRWLYLFFISTALAVLTKSVSGLLFLPAIFLYAIIRKKVVTLLKNRDFYIGFALFLLLTSGYYISREIVTPGYIQCVIDNEWGGRYLQSLEGHRHPFWYYFKQFSSYRFIPWLFILPFGIISGFIVKDSKIRRLTLFSLLLSVFYLLIISFSQTKISWYDLPVYPFLALLTAPLFIYIYHLLLKIKWNNRILIEKLIPFLLIILFFTFPYVNSIKNSFTPKAWRYKKHGNELPYYLQQACRGKNDVHNQLLLEEGYFPNVDFYLYMLKNKGVNIDRISKNELEENQKVIVIDEKLKNFVERNYHFTLINQHNNIVIYQISDWKE